MVAHRHKAIVRGRDIEKIGPAGRQRPPFAGVAGGQQTAIPPHGQKVAAAERDRLQRFVRAGLARSPVLSVRGTENCAVVWPFDVPRW